MDVIENLRLAVERAEEEWDGPHRDDCPHHSCPDCDGHCMAEDSYCTCGIDALKELLLAAKEVLG